MCQLKKQTAGVCKGTRVLDRTGSSLDGVAVAAVSRVFGAALERSESTVSPPLMGDDAADAPHDADEDDPDTDLLDDLGHGRRDRAGTTERQPDQEDAGACQDEDESPLGRVLGGFDDEVRFSMCHEGLRVSSPDIPAWILSSRSEIPRFVNGGSFLSWGWSTTFFIGMERWGGGFNRDIWV